MADEIVLIVEDNDVLRAGLGDLLQMEGFQVETAVHGVDALEKMKAAAPHLIVSDIAMPEMDGIEFYHAVRARPDWVTIPFIFLSARSERSDILASRKLGVEDHLVKPIDYQELVATVRSRLKRNQQLMLVQLEQAYKASLIMMANAIELRDQYTRGHVERVMHYSLLIAQQMQCDPDEIAAIQFGAILHDIGKICLQGDFLSRPGPLSPDEWKEMYKHTIYGADLLKRIPYLGPAAPVIRWHHERWDGQGYPDGLSGEAIPREARIVAVADAFDAMTSGRAYQEAASFPNALQEILDGSGSRYDPAVVEAFAVIWEQVKDYLHNGSELQTGG
jgi:putative two-component system response regulator